MTVEKLNTCATGCSGLDRILQGGLPRNRLYVIEGEPGSGKTTLSLQFLLEGLKAGERSLYITFSESKDELQAVANSHGWDLSKLDIIDLASLESKLSPDSQTTLFHPSEVELNSVTNSLLKSIELLKPARLVFDSVSEMRLLAESPLRYRRQILNLKQHLVGRKITVVFLDDLTGSSQDLQVQSIAHGVLRITRLAHEFGGERRQIRILKLRGLNFEGGNHDCQILPGGMAVYPRMVSAREDSDTDLGQLSSGSHELDSLLGGGLDRGTASLFIGPAGTGKSSLCVLYALAAIARGEKVALFCFDETTVNLERRCRSIGMPIEQARKSGLLRVQKVNPAEMSPGAFGELVRSLVLEEGYRGIVIDSLNGYIQAMPQERFLILQLHELLAFLNNQGVFTLLTLAQQGLVGTMSSPVDLTYLTDTVILSRFFEAAGAVKKAISVVKKRTGVHESTIREYTIEKTGIQVGKVLENFQGVLTGVPEFHGDSASIMKDQKPS